MWNLASHHPARCIAVGSLCVPYASLERGLEYCLPSVDRAVYPIDTFPAGQWEYMRFYEENFDQATRLFQANTKNVVQLLFRKGDPTGFGEPSATAYTQINGWFGPDSYYMNHSANAEYASRALNNGKREMPVLFIAAQYDYTCETITSPLANQMRSECDNLTEAVIYSGHWMAQEKPAEVNHQITEWLVQKVPWGRALSG